MYIVYYILCLFNVLLIVEDMGAIEYYVHYLMTQCV
jgi:hypothetical protein